MYETEDTANRMSKQVRSAVPGAVTPESVDTAELDAPGASQALGTCKHESSSRSVDAALPLSDKEESADRGSQVLRVVGTRRDSWRGRCSFSRCGSSGVASTGA
jgi:hypothetical protein